MTNGNYPATSFNLFDAVWKALLGGAFVGIVVNLSLLIEAPAQTGTLRTWLDWLCYPIAGALGGYLVASLLGRLIPDLSSSEKKSLIFGWAAAWIGALVAGETLFNAISNPHLSVILYNVTEGFFVATAASIALQKRYPNSGTALHLAWLTAYGVVIVLFLVWTKLNPANATYLAAEVIVSNAICFAIGCFLTLICVRSQQKSAIPAN